MEDGIILGAGNPLLDIIAHVDQKFLKRWDLQENNSMPCPEEKIGIFEEIEALNPRRVPGGTVQNTSLVFQWILGSPNSFTVLGTIGKDSEGNELEERMISSGVNAQYQRDSTARTGKCAVLINGHNRSMCTLLGASRIFPDSKFEDPVVSKWLNKARFFYFSCQFFNAAEGFLFRTAEHSRSTGKTFCLNLGSPLSQRRYAPQIGRLLPFVDMLFGNGEEALACGEAQRLEGSLEAVALKMLGLMKKENGDRAVVITQAGEPVIVAQGGAISTFDVVLVETEEIIGTDGAGDAFVGGFLSQFVQQRPIRICVDCGNYAASEIIRRIGCCPPETCSWKEDYK